MPFIFVDFGCADGTIISALYELYKNSSHTMYYIGYDISDSMIALAKKTFSYSDSNVIFTTKWEDICNLIKYTNMKKVLLLSSVIHEVYSYDDPVKFWQMINDAHFDYVCIRDMMPGSDISRNINYNKLDRTNYENFCQYMSDAQKTC